MKDNQDAVAPDQAPMESQPSAEEQQAQSTATDHGGTGHTVGPDFPGVTGSPEAGSRDADRVAEEDDESDEV